MNTEDRDWMLNDYLDDALDADQRAAFERELDADPALRAELEEVRALLQRARVLPLAIEPPRDLWDGIEARIERGNVVRFPRQRRRFWTQLSAFAAAAAIVAIGSVSYYQLRLQPGTLPAPREHTNGPVASADSKLDEWRQAQAQADAVYAEARTSLLDALAKREDKFSERTQADLRETLAVIDNAVHEINLAMAEDPENPALLHMLVATREKELNFLEQLVSGPEGL